MRGYFKYISFKVEKDKILYYYNCTIYKAYINTKVQLKRFVKIEYNSCIRIEYINQSCF